MRVFEVRAKFGQSYANAYLELRELYPCVFETRDYCTESRKLQLSSVWPALLGALLWEKCVFVPASHIFTLRVYIHIYECI